MAQQQIDSPARHCAISGKTFAEGDAVCSFLLDAGKAYERVDMLADRTADFTPGRPVICRWNWTVRPRDNRAREEARSALEQTEALFLALCEEPDQGPEADERRALRHLLALTLLRKRVIRPLPEEPDMYLHSASGQKLRCPSPEKIPEEILRKAAAQLFTA